MTSSVYNSTDATDTISIRRNVNSFAIAAKSYGRCTAVLYLVLLLTLLSLRHLCIGRGTKTEIVN